MENGLVAILGEGNGGHAAAANLALTGSKVKNYNLGRRKRNADTGSLTRAWMPLSENTEFRSKGGDVVD